MKGGELPFAVGTNITRTRDGSRHSSVAVTVHLTIPSKHAARQFSHATIG
jgi:hypothetical protein